MITYQPVYISEYYTSIYWRRIQGQLLRNIMSIINKEYTIQVTWAGRVASSTWHLREGFGEVPKNLYMVLRFGSSGCSIWTIFTSFGSSWPADYDYLSFGLFGLENLREGTHFFTHSLWLSGPLPRLKTGLCTRLYWVMKTQEFRLQLRRQHVDYDNCRVSGTWQWELHTTKKRRKS